MHTLCTPVVSVRTPPCDAADTSAPGADWNRYVQAEAIV
jgi:hypothetical protein